MNVKSVSAWFRTLLTNLKGQHSQRFTVIQGVSSAQLGLWVLAILIVVGGIVALFSVIISPMRSIEIGSKWILVAFVILMAGAALYLFRDRLPKKSDKEPEQSDPAAAAAIKQRTSSGPPVMYQILLWMVFLYFAITEVGLYWIRQGSDPINWWAVGIAGFLLAMLYHVRWDERGVKTRAREKGFPIFKTIIGVGAVLIVGMIVIRHFEWDAKVQPFVYNEVNSRINKVAGFELFPFDRRVGDGFVTDPQGPTSVQQLDGGWIEVTFPANIGWYSTTVMATAGDTVWVEVADSTYTALLPSGDTIEMSSAGILYRGQRVSPAVINDHPDVASYAIRAKLPAGALLMKRGWQADPFYVSHPGMRYRPKSGSSRELFLGLNIPQTEKQQHFLDGDLRVRLKVKKKAL